MWDTCCPCKATVWYGIELQKGEIIFIFYTKNVYLLSLNLLVSTAYCPGVKWTFVGFITISTELSSSMTGF